jgi:hypothetical protein
LADGNKTARSALKKKFEGRKQCIGWNICMAKWGLREKVQQVLGWREQIVGAKACIIGSLEKGRAKYKSNNGIR